MLIENYLHFIQEKILINRGECIIPILTYRNEKIDKHEIQGKILLNLDKFYEAEFERYKNKIFKYEESGGVQTYTFEEIDRKFSTWESFFYNIGILISLEDVENFQDSKYKILELIKNRKPVIYFPMGKCCNYTIFSYFKVKGVERRGEDITKIKVMSHLIKPIVNFKEIEITTLEDKPKYGVNTFLYKLK